MATTHGETRISSRPPPTNSGPGLFGRLLQRTKSKKERKLPVGNKDASAILQSSNVPDPSFQVTATEALATTPQTSRRRAPAPPESTLRASMVHQQQSPPMLRKKTSIRDRFRALAKENPTLAPAQLPTAEKTRVAYVPKHAAADFSRMAVSPRPLSRQGHHYSYEDAGASFQGAATPHSPVIDAAAENEPQSLAGPRHYPQRGLQTLDENEPVQVEHNPMGQSVPEIEKPHLVSPYGDSRQQRLHPATISDPAGPLSDTAPVPAEVHALPKQDGTFQSQAEKDAQQASDYELFLTRAEERERAYREHLLRTLSQRQYPRPEPEATPYQPRGSGTYTADSAVVADASGQPRKAWEGRMSGGLDSGIGSKSSSAQGSGSKPEEPVTRVSNTWERSHRKRASWTPSFGGGGGRDAERKLERGEGDVVPELDEGYTTRNLATAYGEETYGGQQQQQPRTLKRQTSIKQKLGAYIKPARPPSRYGEAELTRGRSKRAA
ncbi:hypothetical protein GE09DRAFT_481762 [Coniochaeta sp. 2T2.1]|nr:hypothetical protein GE09DRAFT_481762 [Coniochaeta sp. 2T2.1]